MALYDNKEYFRCDCGNDQFELVPVFKIEKTQISSTLTKSYDYTKYEIGDFVRCLSCNKLHRDPTNK